MMRRYSRDRPEVSGASPDFWGYSVERDRVAKNDGVIAA